ncbi:2-oxoglutarate dehydrogenase, E2 component, dihydrolipoamide succinyltransferase [Janibacter massiliensis]|uniref:2-oxoglutarate dehydrogenase, E2 component, dihydrolipoamide succinyltransferase n=1 Tax=Janibacter massiliensis TaxID=2058291 RepID=UPI000D0E3F4E|nr:2-oxoglutarate dehydrogenase, E2 component, dihydrolipoamide succinyltransferase [Janibacter massiliensis]
MSERVTMPALGESVTEGTVTRWLKSVGDEVAVDEPLLEVSTDKVDTEIPSPVAGTLQEILVEEDETVEVGADLAVIGDGPAADSGSSDSADAEAAPAQQAADAAQDEAPGEPAQEQSADEPDEAPSTERAEPAEKPTADTGDAGGEGTTVQMPALGESVTEGTVTRWLKAEGDEVAVDEPLLEVSTDKVDTEIPSPVAGTLRTILVQEDETVEVGADLAVIGGGDSAPAAQASEAQASEAQAPQAAEETAEQPAEPQGSDEDSAAEALPADGEAGDPDDSPAGDADPEQDSSREGGPADPTERKQSQPQAPAPQAQSTPNTPQESADRSDASAYVTPLVRKLAADKGVDLASVEGTGVGGRIRKQDVLDAAEKAKAASAPAPAAQQAAPAQESAAQQAASTGDRNRSTVDPAKRGSREKMSRLRKVIAQRMVESLQVSAQLTTVVEVDMTKVARVRDRAKAEFERREGTKLSFLPFIALATAEALKAHPGINASVEGDEIVYHGEENLSIAVDTERGLLTPVVKHAGDLNIAGLARAIADVADRTRTNKITPDDLSGGTFTITNTGSRGALFDTPILNQPQVGMLGTGAIVKRPVVVTDADGGETIAVRSMMYLAMSYDHRVVDGADAARFLGTVKDRLEGGAFEV